MEILLHAEEYGEDAVHDVNEWMINIFNLYIRCRNFSGFALPDAGGIFDQDELTMQCFSIIHEAVEKEKAERTDDMVRGIEQKMRVASLAKRGR